MSGGCFLSRSNSELADEERARNTDKTIQLMLKDELKKSQYVRKILLLGCGEAGKSTFIKQLRIINSEDEEGKFSEEEKSKYKSTIASNIISSIISLVDNLPREHGSHYYNDFQLMEDYDEILKLHEQTAAKPEPHQVFQITDRIQRLWGCPDLQEAYKQRSKFQLIDSAKHFLDQVEEVMNPLHEITYDDILHARAKTEGIFEYSYDLKPDKKRGRATKLCFIDVGGQRGERKKWIKVFESCNDLFLIYLVAVSEFDQVLDEDNQTNRLRESQYLLKMLLQSTFKDTPTIIFLNKKDLLKQKIKEGADPTEHFQKLATFVPKNKKKPVSFKGMPDDEEEVDDRYHAAIEFFEKMFRKLHPVQEKVHVQRTCATDTENIRVVECEIQKTFLNEVLENIL